MEIIIIGLVVAFILYKLFFSSGSKQKLQDAIIGAAVGLGVPEPDARKIIETQMQEVSKLLAYTALPQSEVKHLQAHERMAHCIKIIYNRD